VSFAAHRLNTAQVGSRVLVHDQRFHGFGRIVAAPCKHSTASAAAAAAAAAAELTGASEADSGDSTAET
jgi:hypothetical protein